jgi:hypothetical protein
MIGIAAFGIVGCRTFIFANEDGIIFRDTDNDITEYKWESIRHIYHIDKYNYLEVIDEQGHSSFGHALADHRFKRASDKIRYIWAMWNRKISNEGCINTFKYPIKLLKKNVDKIYSILLGAPLIRGLLMLFLLIGIIDRRALILAAFLLFCHLVTAIPSLIELYRKKVVIISFSQGRLEAIFDDNTVKILSPLIPNKCRIEDPRKVGMAVFANGIKIKNIDRFSHWVVLREYLLRHNLEISPE